MPPQAPTRVLILPLLLLVSSCALPPERSALETETPTVSAHGEGAGETGDDGRLLVIHDIRDAPTEPAPKLIDTDSEPVDTARLQAGHAAPPPRDLIGRIAAGFALPDHDHPRAERARAWFVRHPDYLKRVVERARPYLHLIVEEIEARGMPGEIALLPVVESAFQPFAYSHGRAAGLWQFIPSTGKHYGLKQNWWYDGRRDVQRATHAALNYLQKLSADFDGDWLLALAAYNAGEGTVMRAVRRNAKAGKPTDFWSLKLPRETTTYVPKLLGVSAVFGNPAAFGIDLPEVADAPVLAQVETGGQIDLARAADLAGISVDELYMLNPAFNRWATDPDGPHTLLLPRDKADTFRTQLASLEPDGRLQWRRHRIRSGENLGVIASRYQTTPAVLRQVNQLDGDLIRAGHHLLIPVASKPGSAYSHSAGQRHARNTAKQPSSGSRRVTHTVRGGESLWSIGRRYGVTSRSLARWNGMGTRDTLAVGRELTVWLPPQAGGATSSAANSNDTLQRIRYTVRPGDSLYAIASRFKVSIADLRRWNGLASDLLHPGQKLTLHVDVTRQARAD